jgi:diadenosine tetraphosphate (Ap4A) HIT family hydrolase
VLPGSGTVAYRDDELMALVVHGYPGALVVPRRHVRNLADAPRTSGTILAALRRAVRAVASSYATSGATVEPTIAMSHAPGHVAYWVIPTAPTEVLAGDTDEQSGELVRALADQLSSLPAPQGWRVSTAGVAADASP